MILRCLPLLVLPLLATGFINPWTVRSRFSTKPPNARRSSTSQNFDAGVTAGKPENGLPETLVRDLVKDFQGEFDNYDQVVDDRRAGMAAGSGGGHEHIHCSLKLLDSDRIPTQIAQGGGRSYPGVVGVSKEEGEGDGQDEIQGSRDRPLAVVAAKYYFNGDSKVVFRYRLYSFHACALGTKNPRGSAVMRLWRLLPPVEARLRAKGYELTSFDWCKDSPSLSGSGGDSEAGDAAQIHGDPLDNTGNIVAERMFGCEIYWSRDEASTANVDSDTFASVGNNGKTVPGDPAEAPGLTAGEDVSMEERGPEASTRERCFLGLMGEDDSGTWVSSQNVNGLEILIKDDLRLWPDRLWVNDRGFDRQGNFVYGNQRGVPYKMRRVVEGGPLEWTLGERYRSEELYAEKMSAIGVVPRERVGTGVPSDKSNLSEVGAGKGKE